MYRVTLAVAGAPAHLEQHAWRGKVVIFGQWSSPAGRAARHGAAVVMREFGM